jgi:hypothetical protein
MKLLKKLYRIYSPSGKEEKMSEFVQNKLKQLNITDFKVDENLQIYKLIPNTPMLCAHMDHVGKTPIKEIYRSGNYIIGDKNIGADDKNGIWIILKLLQKFPNTSFIFSTSEERGGDVVDILTKHEKELESIKYCLVFDRKNGSDIIGTKNEYCTEEFEKDVLEIGKMFGYKSATGVFSDCDILSHYISCVNLSCGYYNAHTDKEFTKTNELVDAFNFGRIILKRITKKYEKPEKLYRKRSNWRYVYSNFWEDEYNLDYYNLKYCSKCDTCFYKEDKTKITICPTCSKLVSEDYDSKEYINYCVKCNEYYEDNELCNELFCPVCHTLVQEIEIKDSLYESKKEWWEENYYFCPKCSIYFDYNDYYISIMNHEEVCPICRAALIKQDTIIKL